MAKPGVVAPAVALCETFGIEGRESAAEFMAALDKFPPSAVAAHLYEAGYRPTSNAYRSARKPSEDGLRRARKLFRGRGMSAASVYDYACRCDSKAAEVTLSAATYRALKDIVLRFGATPAVGVRRGC